MKPILLSSAAILLSALAPPAATLQPGLWRYDTVPTGASLDGRPLGDLPYTPDGPQDVCMSPTQAAYPVRWFLHDSGTGCTVTKDMVGSGRIDIAATCPGQAKGDAPGTVRLTGTWTPDRYALRFATTTIGENGTMGFTGTIVGWRVGDCPVK